MRSFVGFSRFALVGALAVVALAQRANAAPVFFDFDSVAAGTPANIAVAGQSLRFDLAAYLPEYDEFGDPIPGSDAYRVDPDAAGPVLVGDPSLRGYGAAPSPYNALDALDQGVLLTFDGIVDISLFSVVLDQSPFGFPGPFDIVFQDAAGQVLQLLATEQSVPGYEALFASQIAGVASIYLPSGAYYDNLGFDATPVPEPALLLLTALGLLGAGCYRRATR